MVRPGSALGSLQVLASTIARRTLRGPRMPTWGWREEVMAALARARFARGASDSLTYIRDRIDAGGVFTLHLASWEELLCYQLPAVWSAPPQPEGQVIYYLHGGGYAFGSYRSHRTLIERLAVSARACVFAIDYRLAPEHPCPAAIEDALRGYQWLLDQGYDASQIVFAGDSAGGGLVLSTLMALRDAGRPLPAGALCLSPWLDLTMSGASHGGNHTHDYVAGGSNLDEYAGYYAGHLALDDPRVSPACGDPTGLPPLMIHTGDAEVMRDDAVTFARRAEAAGVDVRLQIWPAQVHVWHIFTRLLPSADLAVTVAGQFVREVTAG
ncbi:MAG: monoterpene epsilon-lactone hydrolase [Myxococcota bacterium]|jgi:monoterpene epsilon-lactone hydrolase